MVKASSSKKSNKGWIVAIIFTVIVIAGLNINGTLPYSSPNQAVVVPQVYTLPLLSQGQVFSINPGSYYLVNFTIPQGAYSINVTGSYNSQGKIEVAILTQTQYGAFTQNPSSISSSQYYYGDTQGSTINAQLSSPGQYTLIFYDPGIFTQDTVTIVNQITLTYAS
jgi:hypothetical protein